MPWKSADFIDIFRFPLRADGENGFVIEDRRNAGPPLMHVSSIFPKIRLQQAFLTLPEGEISRENRRFFPKNGSCFFKRR